MSRNHRIKICDKYLKPSVELNDYDVVITIINHLSIFLFLFLGFLISVAAVRGQLIAFEPDQLKVLPVMSTQRLYSYLAFGHVLIRT